MSHHCNSMMHYRTCGVHVGWPPQLAKNWRGSDHQPRLRSSTTFSIFSSLSCRLHSIATSEAEPVESCIGGNTLERTNRRHYDETLHDFDLRLGQVQNSVERPVDSDPLSRKLTHPKALTTATIAIQLRRIKHVHNLCFYKLHVTKVNVLTIIRQQRLRDMHTTTPIPKLALR